MTIDFNLEAAITAQEQSLIEQAIKTVLDIEGLNMEGECSVSIVDSTRIHALNLAYRQVDKSTDVLSFPQVKDLQEARAQTYLFLGDIVINLDQVKIQAAQFGHSVRRELAYLTIHSLYHLLGFDHESQTEKKIMRAKEEFAFHQLEEK